MLPLVEVWATCPACARETPRTALHVVRNRNSALIAGPYFGLLGCQRCGLVFVSPRPSATAVASFYVDESRDGWTVRHDEAHAEHKRRKKQQLAARALAPILASAGRALDIGCGAGDILNALQDAGWQTSGIEPHTALREIAGRRHALINEIPRTPTYDIIVLHHVIEHVLDVHQLLVDARGAATPGARLLVGVPAFEDAALSGNLTRACGPVHLNGFTLPALRNAVTTAGWSVINPPDGAHIAGRHILYAVASEPGQPEAGALGTAIDVLQRYGRQLDKSGEFGAALAQT